MRYCKNCGFAGTHQVAHEISGAQWAWLIVLFFCFIVPGIIYGIYLAASGGSTSFYECPKCGARLASVPIDSPIARAEMADKGISRPPPASHPVLASLGRLAGRAGFGRGSGAHGPHIM